MSLIKTGPFAHFDCGDDCDEARRMTEPDPLKPLREAICEHDTHRHWGNDGDRGMPLHALADCPNDPLGEAARLVMRELDAEANAWAVGRFLPHSTERIAYWRAKCQEMSGEL